MSSDIRPVPWPWASMLWPLQFAESLYAAPERLQQSILPWTFAGLVVNESNSSNPVAERAIVSKESYGKQLGRISDALDSLIKQTNVKRDDAINAFLEIKAHIDDIKHSTETTRFEAVLVDLKKLRERNEALFEDRLKRVAELGNK
ncbi:hypothetical protein [Paraburkholderia solisilvae]|uniref:Uncharacterized protein n=1 Tax=Paraburkholderia solisilvae TaxID=624376 RepID=A0A6J5DH98_9BURK|nr:hypothetical protein [Paraburkholderia solisilvae]CAB3753508.1 hypothetical protein LMG29739_01749 [Paraburkholderia solisilvae]